MRKMLLVIYQNKIQQRAERNNFPLHNHRVTKLSRVASFNATLEFLVLKTGILTIYTVLLNNKVVKRPIKWKIANFLFIKFSVTCMWTVKENKLPTFWLFIKTFGYFNFVFVVVANSEAFRGCCRPFLGQLRLKTWI